MDENQLLPRPYEPYENDRTDERVDTVIDRLNQLIEFVALKEGLYWDEKMYEWVKKDTSRP